MLHFLRCFLICSQFYKNFNEEKHRNWIFSLIFFNLYPLKIHVKNTKSHQRLCYKDLYVFFQPQSSVGVKIYFIFSAEPHNFMRTFKPFPLFPSSCRLSAGQQGPARGTLVVTREGTLCIQTIFHTHMKTAPREMIIPQVSVCYRSCCQQSDTGPLLFVMHADLLGLPLSPALSPVPLLARRSTAVYLSGPLHLPHTNRK